MLTTLAADVREVFAGAPGRPRQVLRKLFARHHIECQPFVKPDGTRGYRFRTEGSYAAFVTGRLVATDGRVPEGICPLGTTLVVECRAAQVGGWSPRGD